MIRRLLAWSAEEQQQPNGLHYGAVLLMGGNAIEALSGTLLRTLGAILVAVSSVQIILGIRVR